MVSIAIFMLGCLCLGLVARRFEGRAHILLVAAVVLMVVYEVISLYRL